MREPLQKFSSFANQLLPHETTYLLSVQKFADPDRLRILQQVDENCHKIEHFVPYDISIDKRKYNHLQNWIEHVLKEVDVDVNFEWLNQMEQKIMTDSIELDEEKILLDRISKYEHPIFYFQRFYELVEHFRQFLLIRIRYSDYDVVDHFLHDYSEEYQKSKSTYNKLHLATRDIVGQYSGEATESIHWETWLNQIFYDESIDGLNRYLALVRLIFISFNYAKYEILRDKFDYLDVQFLKGQYYSKRLLLNYYNNRLLFHSHFREYEKAVHYGYLSIRAKNHDYIHYVNNLCAVLLRLERNEEALLLMKKASPDIRNTGNMHSKVGFASFYLEAMNKNKLYKHAENYGDSFLQAFDREVLQYRWHLFFSVYFQTLLSRKNFEKILDCGKKYKLMDKDQSHQNKPNYLPTIPLYLEVSNYKMGSTDRKTLLKNLIVLSQKYNDDQGRDSGFQKLLQSLQPLIPEVINYLPNMHF